MPCWIPFFNWCRAHTRSLAGFWSHGRLVKRAPVYTAHPAACGSFVPLHFQGQHCLLQHQLLGQLQFSEGKAKADLAGCGGYPGLLNPASVCRHKVWWPAHIAAALMCGSAADVLCELPGSLCRQPPRSAGPVQQAAFCRMMLRSAHCKCLHLSRSTEGAIRLKSLQCRER